MAIPPFLVVIPVIPVIIIPFLFIKVFPLVLTFSLAGTTSAERASLFIEPLERVLQGLIGRVASRENRIELTDDLRRSQVVAHPCSSRVQQRSYGLAPQGGQPPASLRDDLKECLARKRVLKHGREHRARTRTARAAG